MTCELGIIADLLAAEVVFKTKHLILGFDSSTREGVHINCVHLTTQSRCQVIAMDQLAGGIAEDDENHGIVAVDNLSETYSKFHTLDFKQCCQQIINISNTMTDRAAVNRSTVLKIEEAWGKSLNELNCHLHPLDTMASACRQGLKPLQQKKGLLYV